MTKALIIVGVVILIIVFSLYSVIQEKKEKTRFERLIEIIVAIILVAALLLSPLPILYIYDNLEKYRGFMLVFGFVGYYVILSVLFVYYFARPTWNKWIRK